MILRWPQAWIHCLVEVRYRWWAAANRFDSHKVKRGIKINTSPRRIKLPVDWLRRAFSRWTPATLRTKIPGILPTPLAKKKTRKRISDAPTNRLARVKGATGRTSYRQHGNETMVPDLLDGAIEPEPGDSRKHITSKHAADAVTEGRAEQPASQCVQISQKRAKRQNRGHVRHRHREKHHGC